MAPHTQTTPATGCVWAVDSDQQAHVVRWYAKTGEAALQSVGEPRQEIVYIEIKRGSGNYDRKYKHTYPTHDVGERVAVAV